MFHAEMWGGRDAARAGDEEPTASAERQVELVTTLFRELFQSEQSAVEHPRIEAERLGEVAPARIMGAVSAHAGSMLREIQALAVERELLAVEGGRAVGSAFSTLRQCLGDLFLSHEKSYRGTLLGMRHGIDLVTLLQQVATEGGDVSLAVWCGHWLEERRALVEKAADELAWFAAHPKRAMRPVNDSPIAYGIQALVRGVELVAGRLRARTG